MHERCPVCGLKFEREQGYFLGAMYISFGLALVTLGIITVAFWLVTGSSFEQTILWGFLLFLPLVPFLTLFSRVLWIYMDQAIDPDSELR